MDFENKWHTVLIGYTGISSILLLLCCKFMQNGSLSNQVWTTNFWILGVSMMLCTILLAALSLGQKTVFDLVGVETSW